MNEKRCLFLFFLSILEGNMVSIDESKGYSKNKQSNYLSLTGTNDLVKKLKIALIILLNVITKL